MPYNKKNAQERRVKMVKVFIKEITDINADEIQKIIDSLSAPARERLDKKKNEALRLASFCALSLLTEAERRDLDYSAGGRPFFKMLDADISISHSQKYVAVAISNKRDEPVGVDIENTLPNPERYSRFFTENERASVQSGAREIEIWAKKEALFKHLKNDGISFITLDTTESSAHFTTVDLGTSILTVCTPQDTKIEITEK